MASCLTTRRIKDLLIASAVVTFAHATCLTNSKPCRVKSKDAVLLQRAATFETRGEELDHAEVSTDSHMVMPWSQGCIIGGGFDFEHGCTYPQAMNSIPPCDALSSNTRGVACTKERMSDKVTSYTRDVRTSSDYSNLLDTTTAAEAGGWGISVSTSVGVLTKSAWSTSSMSFILGGSGEVKTTSVEHPVSLRLNEAAAGLLKKDPVGFLDRYSPYYVHSIVHGGSFLGSVTLNSKRKSSTDAFSFALGFSVNLGFFSVGMSHKFKKEVEKSQEDVEMTLTADWLGGTGIHLSSEATPESLAESYQSWSDSWRDQPHELKIVLRRWIDIEEVQSIVNDQPPEIRQLFNQDTLKPTIQAMLTKENAEMSLLKNSLRRALDWDELRRNRTLQDEWDKLNFEVQMHMLAIEHLDHIGVLQRQNEILKGDRSWFAAKGLTRKFEDMRLALGKHCDDGNRVVKGICKPWEGKCQNGDLLPVWDRREDNECGSCHRGHVLVDKKCLKFILSDKMTTEERHDGHGYDGTSSSYIAERSQGYICGLQEVGVEDLGNDFWSESTCKVYPEFGRWKMDARAIGAWTDARCSSRCLETSYPVTQQYLVDNNRKRESGVSGVKRKTAISTVGSICWLSLVSFWQLTHGSDWAECSIKPNAENMWEVQASVKQTGSHTGAECGAICMHDLPSTTFTIENEVMKHSDQNDCVETDLGSSESRTCFLSSMAAGHAKYWWERPRCDLKIKVLDADRIKQDGGDAGVDKSEDVDKDRHNQKRWVLRTCTGHRRQAEAMCGARCITFS